MKAQGGNIFNRRGRKKGPGDGGAKSGHTTEWKKHELGRKHHANFEKKQFKRKRGPPKFGKKESGANY